MAERFGADTADGGDVGVYGGECGIRGTGGCFELFDFVEDGLDICVGRSCSDEAYEFLC